MTIEIGSTYSRKVGDITEPVTINRVCDWGGWYGTTEDGKSVRVTEKSLITSNSTPTVQEDTNMASKPAARVTAADRRNRRAANSTTATVELSTSEKLDLADSTAKPSATTPRNANGTIKAKPKAKPVAKTAPKPKAKPKPAPAKQVEMTTDAPYGYKSDGTPRKRPVPTWLNGDNTAATESTPKSTPKSNPIKESNTMPVKSTRKPAAKSTAKVEPTIEEQVAKLAAKLAAEMVAEMIGSGEIETAVEPVVKRSLKPVADKAAAKSAKTVKVTLKAKNEKRHSWHFGFMGKAANPVCTGCYITKDAIAQFEAGEKSITVEFDVAEGKKHSILFREAGDSTVFNGSLYLMRNALNGSGITEDTPITVVATVKSADEITLTISAS